MFQKILESVESKGAVTHTLENGTQIQAYEVGLLDAEVLGIAKCEEILNSITKNLKDGEVLKLVLKSNYSQEHEADHSRSASLRAIGHVENKAYLVLEKSPFLAGLFKAKTKTAGGLSLDLSGLRENGILVRSLDETEINKQFPVLPLEIYHRFQTIDIGSELVSILRITRQSEFGMDMETLSLVKDELPLPYTIVCNVQLVSQASAETLLRRRSKQNSQAEDLKEGRKFSEAQDDLEDVSLNGSRLYSFEWLCLINRQSEEALRADREEAKRKLSELGDSYIESVGALRSLQASLPGEGIHFALLEKDSTLSCYLPLVTRGGSCVHGEPLKRSLALHRRDESVSYIDIFDPTYESFSWCIFGRPGTGKSVLVNAITRALSYDPNIKIIKIDVGGSHSRETSILGGVEKTLNLNEPTGLNPFLVLEELGPTKEALQILSSFIEVLVLEEGESKLTKTMKSDLEKSLNSYAELSQGQFSLEEYFLKASEIPRKDLLRRWVGSGVYGNAFVSDASGSPHINSNLLYYNFSKISQALDPDYAQGGLAAVMAQFNLEMLKKSQDKKRIVFIADETPFFIKKCFSFFNLSIANIRKEGHGFITVAQKSAHVVVDGDTGILDNSPNKIFFSMDGDEDSFKARTQVSTEAVEKIRTLQRQQGQFSEAFLKDGKGERVLKVRLSPEEYWAYSSKDEDRRKFIELREACPSLETKEIVRCLSFL